MSIKQLFPSEESFMAKKNEAEPIYKIVEVIGTSTKSWEDAAMNAVNPIRNLRRVISMCFSKTIAIPRKRVLHIAFGDCVAAPW